MTTTEIIEKQEKRMIRNAEDITKCYKNGNSSPRTYSELLQEVILWVDVAIVDGLKILHGESDDAHYKYNQRLIKSKANQLIYLAVTDGIILIDENNCFTLSTDDTNG